MTDDLNQPPSYVRPMPYVPPEQTDNGIGVASLVCGIIGLICSFIPVIGLISWLLAPAAIITGIMSFGRPAAKGLGIGGLITGILALIVCILWLVLFGAFLSAVGTKHTY